MLFLKSFEFIDWTMIVAWAIIFIITLVIELETMNLTTIWFCVSSLVALISGVIFAGPLIQISIFVGMSVILILLTRPLTKKMMNTEIIRTNADRVLGMVGIVTQKIIPNEIGEVKVLNNLWRAINNEDLTFEVGEKVSIDAITGIKLVVSKVNGDSDIQLIQK